MVLRPSSNFLGSSRATHRASLRAERLKALWQVTRSLRAVLGGLWTAAVDLALLCGLPLAYLAAAYLTLDLPARYFAHRGAHGKLGILLFLVALAIAATGIVRAVQDAPPVAPVRPKFARAMLLLSWVAAVLFTIGDLSAP
jgi:hypothetical protein